MPDDYQDCLDFLYGRLNFERTGMPRGSKDLRLGRMRRLLRLLGDPQDALAIVHVGGTKGKGSTAAMIAAGLAGSGVRTGLFCSPHLHRLEERFTFDGRPATAAELVELTHAVRPAVAAMDERPVAGRDHRGPTFFEVTTAMGLLHFARRSAGAVVLEVGMGGRLDSTNVVRPRLAVLTTISFDHVKQLGNTLGAIAGEKAGILKRGCPAVVGVRGSEARDVIARAAERKRSPVRWIDGDFRYAYRPPASPPERPTPGTVVVQTWRRDWPALALPVLGAHQAHNAAIALAALDALGEQGWSVGPDDVRRGFADLCLPARVEVVGADPCLVIDGAHNVASAEALVATLRECFPPTRRTLVFGTSRDKDMEGELAELLPLFDECVATRYVENPRALTPEEVAEAITRIWGRAPRLAADPAEALRVARDLTPRDGLICVTGSLFLAAEARAIARAGREDSPSFVEASRP